MAHLGIFEEIEISKIDYTKKPLRTNFGSIEELASSILDKGLLQPIVVRLVKNRFEVVAGNRRLSACKMLKWRKIPCHLVELDDKEAYEVSLIENVQHKTLNPIEEAMAYKKYVEDFGWGGISALAKKIGKSQEYVSRRIQLLNLPKRVQDKIMRRRISPGIAQELLYVDEETAERFAEVIADKGLKRDDIRRIVKCIKHENATNDPSEITLENSSYDKMVHVTDAALRKCITILRSTLVRLDEVVNGVDDDWITREMLMQYRMIIHGDIDTFLRLRKRLESKMRPTYNLAVKVGDNDLQQDDTSLYMYKGVWQ